MKISLLKDEALGWQVDGHGRITGLPQHRIETIPKLPSDPGLGVANHANRRRRVGLKSTLEAGDDGVV